MDHVANECVKRSCCKGEARPHKVLFDFRNKEGTKQHKFLSFFVYNEIEGTGDQWSDRLRK